jgi:hypothetical protein
LRLDRNRAGHQRRRAGRRATRKVLHMSSTNWPAKISYNLEEAKFASGLSLRSLQRAIETGALRSAFVLGRRRIAPADLEAFMSGAPMPAAAPANITVRRFA